MKSRLTALCTLVIAAAAAAPLARAQAGPSGIDAEHRLFLRFVEDAAIVPSYWLEGQIRFDLDLPALSRSTSGAGEADLITFGPVFAANVAEDFEFGGRVGVGYRDPDPGSSESGMTDLDLWGKVSVVSDPFGLALGILVKVPTASEDDLLGTGEVDVAFFAGARKDLRRVTFTGNVGLRVNQDPDFDDVVELEGKTSLLVGAGAIFPFGDRWSLTAEWAFETERFEGLKNDSRALLGLEYRIDQALHLRGALAGGLSDGAPDWTAIGSAVWLL